MSVDWFWDRNLFFSKKKVGRLCITHLLMTTQARASCCVRLTASTCARSTTKARLRWTWPSFVQEPVQCVLCSSWTLMRARRASRRRKSCSCLMNIANDQLKKIISCLFERNFKFIYIGNWTNRNSQSSARRTTRENSKILQIWSGKYINICWLFKINYISI